MLQIAPNIFLDEDEIKLSFIRAPGPGGQNVNKVATAVQLRFNVTHAKSLPENIRNRLLTVLSNRLTSHGDIIIKASRYRTQERNKQDALLRLQNLLEQAAIPPKPRKKYKPTVAAIEKRLAKKKLRAKTKLLRQRKINHEE